MRVFVAGATGVVGRRLVPMLIKRGHQVVGMTRSPEKALALKASGARPAVADALDEAAVLAAVRRAKPEVVVDELTAFSGMSANPRRFDHDYALTNQLRIEGTDYLLSAARAVRARRFVAQSFAGWPYGRKGGALKTEVSRLDSDPLLAFRASLEALEYLEEAVEDEDGLEGLILRYGNFYGPGTSLGPGGAHLETVRARRFPIVGRGTGVWSFLHVQDAALATVAAVEGGEPGVYNVVDDDPAPVSEWLPILARAIGAKRPRHVPVWIAGLVGGEVAVMMGTQIRGASNVKAKAELGWQPSWPSWREGFRRGLVEPVVEKERATARRPRTRPASGRGKTAGNHIEEPKERVKKATREARTAPAQPVRASGQKRRSPPAPKAER